MALPLQAGRIEGEEDMIKAQGLWSAGGSKNYYSSCLMEVGTAMKTQLQLEEEGAKT
jgi:hypothetical protein